LADQALLSSPGKPVVSEKDIRTLAEVLHEPPDVSESRRECLSAYQSADWPDRVQHLWRYTDPRRVMPEQLKPDQLMPSQRMPSSASQIEQAKDLLPQEGPAVLITPNMKPEVNASAREAGVVLESLSEAREDLAQLGQAVRTDHGLFEALNGAAWNAGLLVKIPRGKLLAEPLRVLIPAMASTNLPRLLVVVEDGASATVVEEHVGGNAGTHSIGVSELFVGTAAQLRHVIVQQWGAGVVGHLTTRTHLERDAQLFTVLASFGGSVVKLDLGAALTGEGAQSEFMGVALGEGRQHFDHHTEHRHIAGHTWSNLDFKVALTGRSRSVYTGLIRIEENAPGSEAYQENRNLMLSEKCRADTIPELEILTDEVSCSHGATVAPVDPEQLFYLASRSISGPDALRLVVRGYLENTLRRIPAGLRDGIESLVTERLTRLVGEH